VDRDGFNFVVFMTDFLSFHITDDEACRLPGCTAVQSGKHELEICEQESFSHLKDKSL
jgi:hypothetical protein